jgi:hypothetical protein
VDANSGTAVCIIVASGCVLSGPCADGEKRERRQVETLLLVQQAVALCLVVSFRSLLLLLLFNERAIMSSLASPRATATLL